LLEAGKEFSCSWKAADRPPAYCLQPSRLEMASRNQTMSDQKETGVESLSIEQAMERLENLVREMETGQMPLDRLISSYEEGVQLAGLCQEKLDAAAKKIQIIAKNASGQTKLEDFPLTADEP
jgi:exodeoxyribonuclease VII small subunit